MATVNTPFLPSKTSQTALINYIQQISSVMNNQWNLQEKMRLIDLAYIREQDFTKENVRAKVANAYGDSNRFQNITVPVVMPQVEAFVTYQTSVFLTGSPIFGVATSPEFINESIMLESIIEAQQIRAGWTRELMMFFRDGAKYNLSGLEVNWDTWNTAQLTTDVTKGSQAQVKNKVWSGNKLRRLDPYNMFFDARVAPSRVYCEGEFAGWTEIMSRIRLKEFLLSLPVRSNVTEAFESGTGSSGNTFYIPDINQSSLFAVDPKASTNWSSWAGLSGTENKIAYKDIYEVTTVYCKILPSDFKLNLPEANTPQIFKLVIINKEVIVYVERQTNAHGWLPILLGVPNEDGLNFQTKSLADNAVPFQQVSSAMMNSIIHSRRRAATDRVLYDPSRIAEHVINSDNPAAKMPVRPSAYGKPVGEAVYAFPFRDDQAGLVMQEIQTVLSLSNEVNGQNKAKQGQFVKGNKTQSEFQTVMANANGRDQLTALLYETQIFTPLKEMIKINILQYQGAETIFSKSKNEAIKVDPVRMRDAVMEFKVSDGLVPTDKLMDADAFTVALQTLGSSPQLSSGYNVAPLFSYLMKQRGADLRPFEKSAEQIAYEQAVQSWQVAVAEALKAGVTPDQLPPQPTPEQYGYQPQGVGTSSQPKQTANVNNITNNITNNRSEAQ